MNSEPDKVKVTILSKKDLAFSYYCGPGHGGQAKNKIASGVMIRHEESGAMARCHESRSQDQNKRAAFDRLLKTPQMKFWLAKRIYEVQHQETIEEAVAKETTDEKLKFEIKMNGKWEQVSPDYFNTDEARSEQ